VLHLIRELAHVLLAFFHAYELPTLFLAALIEEAGVPIPIPTDTLMVLAGSQNSGGLRHAVVVIAVTSMGVFLGSSLLFYVMRKGGRPLLARYGHYLHLRESHLESMEGWFVRYGRWTIIVARLIPGLRIVVTVIAGISGLSYAEYAPVAAIAAVVWSTFYYSIGSLLGQELPLALTLLTDIEATIPHWVLALIAAILLLGVAAVGGWLIWRWKRSRPTSQLQAGA